jgi:glycosyltransferase involved in cell wall biosynthesis
MKLGIFVGEEMWTFFREITEDLAVHYQTEIYKRKRYNTPLFYGRLDRWSYRKGIRDVLNRNDVCFFEWASDLLMTASHMPKRSAIITRLHSFELYEWAPKINWDAVDKVILVSKAMQGMFGELYPDHYHKSIVIYNGRSLDAFQPPVQRNFHFKIGMLCAITPIKRIYEVILAVADLRDKGFDIRLHIAGEPKGDYRYAAALKRLVDILNLQSIVSFDGFVTDTPVWLHTIDIFISNSYWEGQQVALLEAMASGCYCLSHFWDGAEEMLPQENLYVTESELQQKIIDYYEMSDAERSRGNEQLRTIAIEKFDIEETKVLVRNVIEDVRASNN